MGMLLEPREGHEPEMAQCIAIARKSIKDARGHLDLLDAVLAACPNGTEKKVEGEEWISAALVLAEVKARGNTLVEAMAEDVANDVFCVVSNIHDRYPQAKAGDLREIAEKLLADASGLEKPPTF